MGPKKRNIPSLDLLLVFSRIFYSFLVSVRWLWHEMIKFAKYPEIAIWCCNTGNFYFLYFSGFLVASSKVLFWEGGWALGYNSVELWDFPDLRSLSLKSFGNSWDISYIPCLLIIIALRFSCGENKKVSKYYENEWCLHKWRVFTYLKRGHFPLLSKRLKRLFRNCYYRRV